MIRIVFELFVLLLIVGAVLYLARLWDTQRRPVNPVALRTLPTPPEATWHATHHGTADDRTEVLVELRSAQPGQVFDRRTCTVIANQDPDYDRLLYNAIEDARNRAALLNSMREE